MATATYVLEVDWDNDGTFGAGDDITADVLSIECARGRDYASQLTGRATAGRLRAVLLNNSGKYSPFNASSPLYGKLLPGRKVRLRTTAPVAATLWTGYLDRIEPQTRAPGSVPTAVLVALGPLSRLQGKRVTVAPSPGDRTGTLIAAVLDDVGIPAAERFIDTGQTITGPWFVEDMDALNAVRELEETEMGYLYESEDGKVVFEDRHHRWKADHLSSQATFSDAAGALLSYDRIEEQDVLGEIFNEAIGEAGKYQTGTLGELWRLEGESPTIGPGQTRTFWADYPPPSQPDGAYVQSWVTPVVGTDITVSGVSSSDISVTAYPFARSMRIDITNNHPSQVATITLLRARGTPVLRKQPATVSASNAQSQGKYGKRTFRLPGPWYGNSNDAWDLVNYIVSRYGEPVPRLALRLPANRNNDMLTQALTRRISDVITVVAQGSQTQMGLNEDFFIERVEHRIDLGGGRHVTEWQLSHAHQGDRSYWVLGTSLLGISTKLAV